MSIFSRPNAIICNMKRVAPQTGIVSGVETKINLDTIVWDTLGMGDAGNSWITIKVPGYYDLYGMVYIDGAPTVSQRYVAILKKNGVTLFQDDQGSNGWYPTPKVSYTDKLLGGDIIELYVQQFSGGNRATVGSAIACPMLTCKFIGV